MKEKTFAERPFFRKRVFFDKLPFGHYIKAVF